MANPNVKNEQRRAQRVKKHLRVKYRLENKHCWKSANCRDISGVGIGMNLLQPIEVDDIIEISFPDRDNARSLKATYRVIWHARNGSGKYRVGLELIKTEDHPGFIEFVCNLLVSACLPLEDPVL